MFTYFIITFVFFVVLILAMSIGYWIKKQTITGSCGGLSTLGIEKECHCDTPCEKRLERERIARETKLKKEQII